MFMFVVEVIRNPVVMVQVVPELTVISITRAESKYLSCNKVFIIFLKKNIRGLFYAHYIIFIYFNNKHAGEVSLICKGRYTFGMSRL